MLLPAYRVAIFVGLLHRQMNHRPMGRGAVPVSLARLKPNRVSGEYLDNGLSVLLHATDAGQNVE